MKIAVNKSRLGLVLIALGAVIVVGALVLFINSQNHQITVLKIQLHAVPTHPVAMQTVTPTASPTASLKFTPVVTKEAK